MWNRRIEELRTSIEVKRNVHAHAHKNTHTHTEKERDWEMYIYIYIYIYIFRTQWYSNLVHTTISACT